MPGWWLVAVRIQQDKNVQEREQEEQEQEQQEQERKSKSKNSRWLILPGDEENGGADSATQTHSQVTSAYAKHPW